MFNPNASSRQLSIFLFLMRRQLPVSWSFVRYRHGHVRKGVPQITQILQQLTACRQRIGCQIGNRLFVIGAFKGVTQEQNARLTIGEQYVFYGVVVRLTAPVVFLFTRVFGARDGSFGAVVKKRVSLPSSAGRSRRWRNSSSVRDGARWAF